MSTMKNYHGDTESTHPGRTACVTSAEDAILAKLEWYQMGG